MTIRIVAPAGDKPACRALASLVKGGQGGGRRHREFERTDICKWTGEIRYGGAPDYPYGIEVEAHIVPPEHLVTCQADWLLVSGHVPAKVFSFHPERVSRAVLPLRELPHCRRLVLRTGAKGRDNIPHWAANQLAAELTTVHSIESPFLSFPGGRQSRHYEMLADWVSRGEPIKLLSGCCLHATENRSGVAERLNPTILTLLARTAKAAFQRIPGIHEWEIYTFGPQDYEWLGDLGISKVLLPYMWNAPAAQVKADLARNFRLTLEVGELLQSHLPFSVKVTQLCKGAENVDLDWLMGAARQRAEIMLPKLMEHPPLIFGLLQTREECFARVQQEAFLYLYDTFRFGQVKDEKRPAVLYVGLEVHGGYWEDGFLHEGPNGEFLPLAWLPQSVRQHWADWVLKNQTLARERQRLEATLNYLAKSA